MKAKIMLWAAALLLFAQCTSRKEVIPIDNGVIIRTYKLNIKVQFYRNDIVRIQKWLTQGSDKKLSLSVCVDSLIPLSLQREESSRFYLIASPELRIKINYRTGSVEFFDEQNNPILAESACKFSPMVYETDSAYQIEQQFILAPDEGVYGLGQHQMGVMNYRGHKVLLAQANTEAVNPFLVSTKNYGILWDNYSLTSYTDDGKKYASWWSDVADNIDYYLIRGHNIDSVIAGYRYLTGTAPLYGKWAYGYWQSKEHYDNQQEITSIVRKYRALQIPIDNIIQDWDYWNGAPNWGSMQFDKTLFPNPEEMIKEFHQRNFHFMISIWPAMGPNTEIYKEMESKGFLYKPIGWAGFKYYDAYNPQANELYWQFLKKGLASKGVDAWWIDSTEPDVINALTKEASNYELKKMGSNYLGTFARYLNPYSLVMTESIYKHWRKDFPQKRCYILTRSTYAGQQRNAATTWSGDIGANWQVYRNQISAGINHSMSGIPYWTFDIGAFVIGAYEGVFYTGGKNPAYQELYTRMFQLGAFSPIFRSHGSETPREIWEFGEFTQTLIKYDHLRYRLLPYIYSLAWKVTHEGYTIMRGLPMDFPHDSKTFNIDDQYMFGPAIMVAPVTEYMYYSPPQPTIKVDPKFFRTPDGKQGLLARYYKDDNYKILGKEQIDKNIDIFWYTGRPNYVTDSMYSIRWAGKLIPEETGPYQFHMKSFDRKRIFIDSKQLPIAYTSVEQYTDTFYLEAGKSYDIVVETENRSTGAARMQLFWKTPSIFAKEQSKEVKAKVRTLYLPANTRWYNFWTGESFEGGKDITTDAPIDILPLFVRAGSILPMGPFLQYASEKPSDPIELRIYRGGNGHFVLYEDEGDNYNYEKGIYATIAFDWDDQTSTLTIGKRQGEFPGMLQKRTFNIVLVDKNKGTGLEISRKIDKTIPYNGEKITIKF
ncbi:MAG: TIM-barrel domain-containing protein [Bacteroidales bacterium]